MLPLHTQKHTTPKKTTCQQDVNRTAFSQLVDNLLQGC
jgi:hypothetical protein